MVKSRSLKLPTTYSETIYHYIKKEIMDGNVDPGKRVQEKNIAELFGVSTTPVREAFQRLSAEDFLIITARREVIVAKVSLMKIKELFEVVRVLDAVATKKAMKRLTDEDLDKIKKMTKRMSVFYEQKQTQPYFKLNLRIHDMLWKLNPNKFLYQSLVNLAEKCSFYANQLLSLLPNQDYLDSSYKDHLELTAAIEKRDAKKVEKILKSHWGKGFLGEKDEESILS